MMMLAVSTAELTIRMLVALAVVGGLLLLLTRFARSRLNLGTSDAPLQVCNRHQLTKSSMVAVVRAGERHFLVGVNDNAISLLAEGNDLVADNNLVEGNHLVAGDVLDEAPTATRTASTTVDNAAGAVVDVRTDETGPGAHAKSTITKSAVTRSKPIKARSTTRSTGADPATTGATESAKGGAGKRRRGTTSPAPSGMGVIEALRERSVRRT